MTKKSLRDNLAIERTNLANERTLLAYMRTGLAFAGAGFFLIKFFEESIFVKASIVFMATGFLFLLYGLVRYREYRKKIEKE